MRFASRSLQFIRPATLLPALAWLLIIAVAAWVAAGWYWRLAAPRTEMSVANVPTDPQTVMREIMSRNLFGAAPSVDSATPVANSRYRLIGVAANSASTPGFAILQVDDQASIAAIEGQEFEAGVKLLRVLPQSVEIERGGLREILSLSESVSGAPAPINIAPATPNVTNTAPPAAPAQPNQGVTPPPRPVMMQRNAPPAVSTSE